MKQALPFLAVAFSGFLVYLFDKIWGNSIDWEKVKTVKIGEFLTAQVSVYQILIFLVFATAIFLLGQKFLGKKDQFYSKKQRKLRSYNKTTDPDTGILFRWVVYFDYDAPFISDLTAFCTKHGETTLRFINNNCPVNDCTNSNNRIDGYAVKNLIESDLIDRWEKIK